MRRGCIVMISLIVSAVSVRAQEPETNGVPDALERGGISGSIRAGYWSSTRNLDPEDHLGAGMIWVKATRQVTNHFSFLVEGWTALRGPIDDVEAKGETREAFVDCAFQPS